MSAYKEFVDFVQKEYAPFKSERRERKRNKSKKMKVSGAGTRLLQRVIEDKSKKIGESKS